jgi:hypothetical protein
MIGIYTVKLLTIYSINCDSSTHKYFCIFRVKKYHTPFLLLCVEMCVVVFLLTFFNCMIVSM